MLNQISDYLYFYVSNIINLLDSIKRFYLLQAYTFPQCFLVMHVRLMIMGIRFIKRRENVNVFKNWEHPEPLGRAGSK